MSLSGIGGSSPLQQLQQAIFAKADANGDGRLSNDEFLSIGQNLQSGGNSGTARKMRGPDVDGGNFSPETMGSLLTLQQMQARHEARATEIYQGVDADGDGRMTVEELAKDMAAHAPPGMEDVDPTKDAAALIAKADADGDGVLSLDEFKAAGRSAAAAPPPPGMIMIRQEAANEDAEGAANALDANGDGTVSIDELLTSLKTVDEKAAGFSDEAADLYRKLVAKLTEDSASTVGRAA